MLPISDPDVRRLADIAIAMEAEYERVEDHWKTSPFGWIKTKPSRQVGSIGELLVERFCLAKGFTVQRSGNSDFDRLISGIRVEIKFSTLWEGGFFKFQQLRDQGYDAVFCVGVSAQDAMAWVIPKAVILAARNKEQGIVSQHGGRAGSDTAWLTITPSRVPAWLQTYGGTLADALAVLSNMAESR
jgi:hypothetical protein